MQEYISTLFIGALCVVLGITNMKGNINSLHRYHRKRVSEEDILPFGKTVGLGTVICGCSVMALGVFMAIAEYTQKEIFVTIGSIVLIIGLIVGLGISFYAMIKYNKGIF